MYDIAHIPLILHVVNRYSAQNVPLSVRCFLPKMWLQVFGVNSMFWVKHLQSVRILGVALNKVQLWVWFARDLSQYCLICWKCCIISRCMRHCCYEIGPGFWCGVRLLPEGCRCFVLIIQSTTLYLPFAEVQDKSPSSWRALSRFPLFHSMAALPRGLRVGATWLLWSNWLSSFLLGKMLFTWKHKDTWEKCGIDACTFFITLWSNSQISWNQN